MKILHVSFCDIRGGANIAAFDIHNSMNSLGLNSFFLSLQKFSKLKNNSNIQINSGHYEEKIRQYKMGIERRILKFFINDRYNSYSTGLFGSGLVKKINEFKADIVNLHWINGGTLSIFDISKIESKIVWTFHDMWPVCSTEHYSSFNYYKNGYLNYEVNLLNKLVWKFKTNFFSKVDINVVCPSIWLCKIANSSQLFRKNKIKYIPYVLNANKWKILKKSKIKKKFGIKNDEKIIIFGSERAETIKRKNFNFLLNALKYIEKKYKKINIFVFGSGEKRIEIYSKNVTIYFFGHIFNKKYLNEIYSAGELIAVPSVQEAFGLVAAEAMLCGTPCVAFENTGLSDIVDHKVNGYLAKYLNFQDYANGIDWVLKNKSFEKIEKKARISIKNKFNKKKIVQLYNDYYKEILQ